MRVRTIASGMALCVGVLLAGARPDAHHSFAPHFDSNKRVSISGTVKEFEPRNPHSYVHLTAVDENGLTREYVCESHGVTQLQRNGITTSMFKAGTKIRVTGPVSRHDPHMCFFDTDPEFFQQPLSTIAYEYVPSELEVEPFKCTREGLAGTLRK